MRLDPLCQGGGLLQDSPHRAVGGQGLRVQHGRDDRARRHSHRLPPPLLPRPAERGSPAAGVHDRRGGGDGPYLQGPRPGPHHARGPRPRGARAGRPGHPHRARRDALPPHRLAAGARDHGPHVVGRLALPDEGRRRVAGGAAAGRAGLRLRPGGEGRRLRPCGGDPRQRDARAPDDPAAGGLPDREPHQSRPDPLPGEGDRAPRQVEDGVRPRAGGGAGGGVALPAGRLPLAFYARADVLAVARDLLGKVLVVPARGGARVAGIIVETEAYRAPEDRASHAWNGRRTRRTETMYGPGGTAYVYFVYGMYHQFNVVTNVADVPHAVLIRALEPLEGVDLMRRRRGGAAPGELTSGPGKLCIALGIDRRLDGADLLGDRIWLEPGRRVSADAIAAGPRVGIDYAGDWVAQPWRFWLRGNPFVSRARPPLVRPAAAARSGRAPT